MLNEIEKYKIGTFECSNCHDIGIFKPLETNKWFCCDQCYEDFFQDETGIEKEETESEELWRACGIG